MEPSIDYSFVEETKQELLFRALGWHSGTFGLGRDVVLRLARAHALAAADAPGGVDKKSDLPASHACLP